MTKQLNALIVANCDGPVAADTVVYLNRTLSGEVRSTLAGATEPPAGFVNPPKFMKLNHRTVAEAAPNIV